MSSTKNSKSSVGKIDTSVSPDEFSINDELMQIRITLANMAQNVSRLGQRVGHLGNFGVLVAKIGGSAPYNLRARLEGFDPLDREMSDDAYANKLEEISRKSKDPIEAALAYTCLASQLLKESEQTAGRIEKLTKRMRVQKRGPEFENARSLKVACAAWANVLERRLDETTSMFFHERNRSIEAITRVTLKMFNLFPSGSAIVRKAYLGARTENLATFARLDDSLAMGERKHGRLSVGI